MYTILSSDEYREILANDPTEEEIEKIIKTPKLMQDMEEKALSKSVKNVQEKIYKEIEKLVR